MMVSRDDESDHTRRPFSPLLPSFLPSFSFQPKAKRIQRRGGKIIDVSITRAPRLPVSRKFA